MSPNLKLTRPPSILIAGIVPALAYEGADEFRDKIRDYLEKYLKAHHPVTPGKVPPAMAGDPARYLKALREETSHFDVQGLKFGDNRAYRFSIEEFYIPLTTSSSAARTRQSTTSCAPPPSRCRKPCWRIANYWWWAIPALGRALSQ